MLDNQLYLVIAVVAVFLIFFLVTRGNKKTTRRHGPRTRTRPPSSTRSVPGERGALTRHLKVNYSDIELAKRMTLRSQSVPGEVDAWLRSLGRRICTVGIHTQDLNAREKFAAVFVVNSLFHGRVRGAGDTKNYLQRTIILYHRSDVRLKLISDGKYAGTYEISCGVWTTHLPKTVVEEGALERRGKPSAARAIRDRYGRRW